MKKLLFPLSLSLLMVLSSCGQIEQSDSATQSSGESVSSPSSDASISPAIEDWAEEVKSEMSNHFYGCVIPFIKLDNVDCFYESEDRTLSLDGEGLSEGDLVGYADKFTFKDGWRGGDISERFELDEGYVFSFQKAFSTEEGTRYVNVAFYGLNSERQYAVEGNFQLLMFDPYYYEFPTDILADAVAYVSGKEDSPLPPSYAAEYYEFFMESMGLLCYGKNAEGEADDAGYGDILYDDGWIILDDKDDYGYYVAISPDQSYQISYIYDFNLGALRIYLEQYIAPPVALPNWDEESLEQFFYDWGGDYFCIPSFDVEGATYYFYVDQEDNYYAKAFSDYAAVVAYVDVIGVADSDISSYISKTKEAGFDVETLGESNYRIKKQEGQLLYYFDLDFYPEEGKVKFTVHLMADVLPYYEWPSEEVKEVCALYNNNNGEMIPAYSGEFDKILIIGNNIDVYVSDIDASLSHYAEQLLAEGYAEKESDVVDDRVFISPENMLEVTLSNHDFECLRITILTVEQPLLRFDYFPSEEISAALPGCTDVIPALNGASYYELFAKTIEGEDYYGDVTCYFQKTDSFGLGEATKMMDEYVASLKETGYIYFIEPRNEEDYGFLQSPNEQFVLTFRVGESDDGQHCFLEIHFDNLVDGQM